MCEVCAVFGVSPHWADASDPLGQRSTAQGILENRAERAKRLALINRILAPHRLAAADWDGEAYSVEANDGRRALAANLSDLWRVAEQLGRIVIDPLAGDFVMPFASWPDSYRAST
jgi:hypothetical protein